jgi:hypothetical protein
MQIRAIASKVGYLDSSIMNKTYTTSDPYVVMIGLDEWGSDTWAIMSDGKIYMIGYSVAGIGDYEYPTMLEKESPAGSNIVWATARQAEGLLMVDADHQLWWLGDAGYHSSLPGPVSYYEEVITIGTTDHEFATHPYASVPPIIDKLSRGQYAASGIDTDGKLWVWGSDGGGWGLLGQNYTGWDYNYTPIEIWTGLRRGETNTGWTYTYMGWSNAFGIKDGEIWFWGPNSSGDGGVGCNQYVTNSMGFKWTLSTGGIGNEYYLEKLAGGDPEIVQPTLYRSTYPSTSYLAEGTIGSLALGEWNWGDNDTLGFNTIYVRLSNNGDPDSGSYYSQQPEYNAPVKTALGHGSDWIKVMCEEYTTIALKSDGTLWGWGDNYRGSMGHEPGTCGDYDRVDTTPPIRWCEHWTPKEITPPGKTIVDFSAGYYHVIALEADGTAWAVGYDDYEGCLGLGSYQAEVYTWTEIPGIKFQAIQCHYSNSMGIGLDGKVYVWGFNYGLEANTPTHWDFGTYWA